MTTRPEVWAALNALMQAVDATSYEEVGDEVTAWLDHLELDAPEGASTFGEGIREGLRMAAEATDGIDSIRIVTCPGMMLTFSWEADLDPSPGFARVVINAVKLALKGGRPTDAYAGEAGASTAQGDAA